MGNRSGEAHAGEVGPARHCGRSWGAGLAAAAFLLVFVGCSRRARVHHDSFLAMDAVVSLSLVVPSDAAGQVGVAAVRREMERLESILSDYRPNSNVSRINRRETEDLAPETRLLLERAQHVCRETDGAFDVTVRPIKRLWGFGTGGMPHVPAPDSIRALLPHIRCDAYEITADGRFVWRDSLAEIDLGGIAQGFVAACVADTLRALGRRDFLIDVSGDIVCGGRRPGGAPWRIGIQNPRRPDSLLARLDLDVTAVTTSGAYEQFFEQDGKRYHHVFDPRTGWPATGATSVTVLSSDPIAADCYATAVFVMGPERGLAFLERRPDLRGVIVTEPSPGRLHLAWSDDLESRVRR